MRGWIGNGDKGGKKHKNFTNLFKVTGEEESRIGGSIAVRENWCYLLGTIPIGYINSVVFILIKNIKDDIFQSNRIHTISGTSFKIDLFYLIKYFFKNGAIQINAWRTYNTECDWDFFRFFSRPYIQSSFVLPNTNLSFSREAEDWRNFKLLLR